MKIVGLLFLSLIFGQHCYSQDTYNNRLAEILTEIRHLDYFENGVVILNDSMGYGSMYPYWTASEVFYENDGVAFKRGTTYRALVDNLGKNPATSPDAWELIHGPHPYLFLRDSADVQDLIRLTRADHPYFRTYALAALASRKAVNVYPIVVNNLGDTTKVNHMSGDYGYMLYPADLMLWHTLADFSTAQKDTLEDLILKKHTHLKTLEDILLYIKPTPDRYPYVRAIAHKGAFGNAALVALARYKKPEDIVLIRTGFNDKSYYAGYKPFFMAIESFPHNAFKNDLISLKREINMNHNLSSYQYYFAALAAYRDKDCLQALEEFIHQPIDSGSYRAAENRIDNLRLILIALKNHPARIYDPLIRTIEGQLPKGISLDFYRGFYTAWDY